MINVVELSINNSIFRFSFVIFSLTFASYFPNKAAVMHAFLFAAHSWGSVLMSAKYGGFIDLTITKDFSFFVPIILVAKRILQSSWRSAYLHDTFQF